jgi:NAD(P)-dependent dehydrogenase (short-subunit alcohol dehydrogenase family)
MKLGPGISAVVAGGAAGLGASTAEALARAGCKVAILDNQRAPGEALAERLGAIYCHIELSSQYTVDAALEFARQANDIERILVNFAGVAETQPIAWRDPESGRIFIHDIPSFERLLQINLTGTFYLAARSAQAMMTLPPLGPGGERGVIINTASRSAEDGLGGQAALAASEGGVLALTRPMARDLAGEGVRVMTIMPEMAEINPLAEHSDDIAAALKTMGKQIEGLADSARVAHTVLEICENEALNGQVLRLTAQ